MKEMHIKRYQVVIAFVAVVTAAVVMGVYLKQAINDNRTAIDNSNKALVEIQASRVESCERTYKIFRSIINSSVKQTKKDRKSHRLTSHEKRNLAHFMKLLQPVECREIIGTPTVKKIRSTTTTEGN